jgi:hypothetical protein
MPEVKKLHIRCLNCNEWMKSPILFGGLYSIVISMKEGVLVQCPHCEKIASYNKELTCP